MFECADDLIDFLIRCNAMQCDMLLYWDFEFELDFGLWSLESSSSFRLLDLDVCDFRLHVLDQGAGYEQMTVLNRLLTNLLPLL